MSMDGLDYGFDDAGGVTPSIPFQYPDEPDVHPDVAEDIQQRIQQARVEALDAVLAVLLDGEPEAELAGRRLYALRYLLRRAEGLRALARKAGVSVSTFHADTEEMRHTLCELDPANALWGGDARPGNRTPKGA
jgi:hypothetical protein